jgi:mono/diheme cytochrome c family protein
MTRAHMLGIVAASALAAAVGAAVPTPIPGDGSHAAIERGRNLVLAGDCKACHTADGAMPFAGGRAVPTPFGTIYSTNITPDAATGIGTWSADDLWRAMHEGIDREGQHLYPAFPYPWYTKVTREDSDAIKAYLDTLPPVHQPPRPNKLPWPLTLRQGLAAWNAAFFHRGAYAWNAQKSDAWNEGAYLVEGLGHCGACHTPKNFAGAPKRGDALAGGYGENWYATSLANDLRDGLGGWSEQDIVDFLKRGASRQATAFGPMAEVVRESTSHLDDAQLRGIAVYLKDAPQTGSASPAAQAASDAATRGAGVYLDQCAGCHMAHGEGLTGAFPPLKGNGIVQARDAETLVHLVLTGESAAVTRARPNRFAMPAFDWKLSDAEIADLATYLRSAWGNAASPVSAATVAGIRGKVEHIVEQ